MGTQRSPSEIQGLFTALLTPFGKDGRVDHKALSALVHFQMSAGVDGLYPCGSTGLGPLLSVQERKELAETVVREVSGRVPVIIQVGSADTESSVELAMHAEKIGADAVASLTPYYYKLGETAVTKHFETVKASIGVPLLAYNIPQFTGNNLLPKTVASLARNSTIVGVKDSSRDVLQLLDLIEAVPDDFVVMNGTEEYALYAMMMGGNGVVSGGANAYPELFQSLVSAFKSGDLQKATSIQERILGFKEAVKNGPISCYYEILKARGIDVGSPRQPFQVLDSDEKDRLLASLNLRGFPTSAKE
jgi:4-hydroxy-tetrahydrodipicolinate synthase